MAKKETKQDKKRRLVVKLGRTKDPAGRGRVRRQLRRLGHWVGGNMNRICDERCQTAVKEKCTCVCGGKNHGKG